MDSALKVTIGNYTTGSFLSPVATNYTSKILTFPVGDIALKRAIGDSCVFGITHDATSTVAATLNHAVYHFQVLYAF